MFLRAIAEDLASVDWDQPPRPPLSPTTFTVQIQPLRKTTSVSYVEGAVSAAMTMKDDRIYVDQSFFEQYLDADITVNGASATAAASSMASTRNTIRANDYDVKETCAYEKYEVMVPMDDGGSCAPWSMPVGDGPWPTAFTRGPYPNQEETKNTLGEEYAKRGMAYVYQYCRGKGGSEGEYVANVDERADGIASLNWLNDQDWVKSIGMHGHSYLALTTWIVGDSLPDKVEALHVQCYGVLRNLRQPLRTGGRQYHRLTLQNCTDKYSYDFYLESAPIPPPDQRGY